MDDTVVDGIVVIDIAEWGIVEVDTVVANIDVVETVAADIVVVDTAVKMYCYNIEVGLDFKDYEFV